MAKKKYPAKEFGRPRNHFVFGNLVYISMVLQLHNDKMIPSAVMVNWNYHVAPIVEIREGGRDEQYILDPAVSASPTKKLDWYALLTQTTQSRITGSVTCKENALNAFFDDCLDPTFDPINNPADEKTFTDLVNQFLQS